MVIENAAKEIKEQENIKTPYGEIFGGTNTDGPPCTLNGFTGARNGQIIPEWQVRTKGVSVCFIMI